MSLINQMLRDLEQRRTAEAGVSPLGGLSASGAVGNPRNLFASNYPTLILLLAVMVVTAVVVARVLEGPRQAEIHETLPGKDASEGLQPQTTGPEVASHQLVSLPAVDGGQSLMDQQANHPHGAQDAAPEKKPSGAQAEVVPSVPVVAKQTHSVSALALPEKTDFNHAGAADVVSREPETEEGLMSIQPAGGQALGEVSEPAPMATAEDKINKVLRPLTDEQRGQLAFQQGVKQLGAGDNVAAQSALEQALSFAPSHVRARETLVALLLNAGRISEAASRLRDGLQLVPEAASLAELYARILVDQGDVAAAVGVLERAHPAVSAEPEYYALLAALYRQQEKHAQAAQVYQQILLQRPGVASWWMGLALAQDAMGAAPAALKAYERARRAGGLSAEVMDYVRGRITALTPVASPARAGDPATDMDAMEE